MMDLARARAIVIAINDRLFSSMDLPAQLDPLGGISLADMIEAKRLVENANTAARAASAISGGGYTMSCVPDDRLIAAVYALEHYQAQNEAILAVPDALPGWFKALAVVHVRAPGDAPDGDDDVERGRV